MNRRNNVLVYSMRVILMCLLLFTLGCDKRYSQTDFSQFSQDYTFRCSITSKSFKELLEIQNKQFTQLSAAGSSSCEYKKFKGSFVVECESFSTHPKNVWDKFAARYYQKGEASWYGREWHGRKTASGERYDMYALTAAHKTLPMGAMVKVTNLKNNKTVIVRINDRGPFVRGRIIDLSKSAKQQLGMDDLGHVKLELASR